MQDGVLLGLGRSMIPIPRMLWQRIVRASGRRTPARLGFMSEDHHRVRDFAVAELPRAGRPLPPESITVDETPHRARFSSGEEAYSP
jgi:hypothetical protein